MISFESGSESVPAFNSNNSKKVTEENDSSGGKRTTNENTVSTDVVTSNEAGGSKPFITKEMKPVISGVIVIAEGAANPDVKYELYEAVKTVFNISQLKVKVLPMEKNK
jgi:stage III sporulation protein AG